MGTEMTSKTETIRTEVRRRLAAASPGEHVASVAELCEFAGSSTANTVRALGTLVDEGVLEARRGPAGVGGYYAVEQGGDPLGELRATLVELQAAAGRALALLDRAV